MVSYGSLRPPSTISHCCRRRVQNIQLLRKQADFDFTVGHCLVSDENSACKTPVRHNTLSDGDVNFDTALTAAELIAAVSKNIFHVQIAQFTERKLRKEKLSALTDPRVSYS